MKNVCDTIPCPKFLKLIDELADAAICKDVDNKDQLLFSLNIVETCSPPKVWSVPFTYCPFCGTRVEDDWPVAFQQGKPIRTKRNDDD